MSADPGPTTGAPAASPAPPAALEALLARIAAREAVVGVVGLGYVGAGMADLARRAGFRVVGLDTDPARVAALSAAPPGPPAGHRAPAGGAWPRFEATTDPARLAAADALLLCVPTGLDAARRPDLSAVVAAARAVGGVLRPGRLVVLESTTWPGTTRGVLLPELLATIAGRSPACTPAPGTDLFVAYAPERVDPGRIDPPPERIPRLVGGLDAASLQAAVALYSLLVETVVPCRSAEVAEAAKLFENTFRAVNVALANELELVLEPLGLDAQEVIDAAATKPFGFLPFRPGAGAGGHCLPAAPEYFREAARLAARRGSSLPGASLATAAAAINREAPQRLVERARRRLGAARAAAGRDAGAGGDPLRGARVLVLGLGYKRGSADLHGSPGLELLGLFTAAGARVAWHDPLVAGLPAGVAASLPDVERVGPEGAGAAQDDYDLVIDTHGGRPAIRAKG